MHSTPARLMAWRLQWDLLVGANMKALSGPAHPLHRAFGRAMQ
jgi:hypothetical protein